MVENLVASDWPIWETRSLASPQRSCLRPCAASASLSYFWYTTPTPRLLSESTPSVARPRHICRSCSKHTFRHTSSAQLHSHTEYLSYFPVHKKLRIIKRCVQFMCFSASVRACCSVRVCVSTSLSRPWWRLARSCARASFSRPSAARRSASCLARCTSLQSPPRQSHHVADKYT